LLRDIGKPVRIADGQVNIQTKHLWNTNLEHYSYTKLFGNTKSLTQYESWFYYILCAHLMISDDKSDKPCVGDSWESRQMEYG
jgi:hypothetical protein